MMLRNNIYRWSSRLLLTGGAQVAVQFLGFAAGLIIIRFLTPIEYAYYTLALATLGMLTVLSDAGVSTGLMALGGPCWKSPDLLGAIYNEATRYRQILSVVALGLMLPILAYLLVEQKSSILEAVLICLAVLPLFFATVAGQLRESLLKLHQQIGAVQSLQVAGGILRVSVLAGLLVFWPFAWLAVLLAGVVQIIISLILKRQTSKLCKPDAQVGSEIKNKYRTYVRRSLPGAIYYAFSGQINVWLISLLGGAQSIAQVGVAGRLAAACSIISAVVGLIFVPRFSRAQWTVRQQLGIFYAILAGILLCGLIAIGVISLWPGLIPLLVGQRYSDLGAVVVWSIAAAILGIAGDVAFSIAAVKGHIMRPMVSVGLPVLSMVASFLLVGASTPLEVFQMSALYSGLIFVAFAFYATRKLSIQANQEA